MILNWNLFKSNNFGLDKIVKMTIFQMELTGIDIVLILSKNVKNGIVSNWKLFNLNNFYFEAIKNWKFDIGN